MVIYTYEIEVGLSILERTRKQKGYLADLPRQSSNFVLGNVRRLYRHFTVPIGILLLTEYKIQTIHKPYYSLS